MKKTLVAAILGLTVASVMAQSRIQLDTASSTTQPYPYITYGAGVVGHSAGGNLASTDGYTIGVYYSVSPATFTDPSGTGIPGGSFVLGAGTGSTALISADFPGLFFTPNDFTIPGTVNTAYLVIVAYNGADYASSTYRGHSAVFTVAPNTLLTGGGTPIGAGMAGQAFTVLPVPEPSTFALAGLGLASLLIFRRRK